VGFERKPADEDLFLHFSDLDVSCGAPTVVFIGCESHWHVRLYVSVSAQQVGTYASPPPAFGARARELYTLAVS
jgi:hypothetical protein